jgi:hypothetical protein
MSASEWFVVLRPWASPAFVSRKACANKEKVSEIAMQRQEAGAENRMTAPTTCLVRPKVRELLLGAAAIVGLILPAQAQDFGERSYKPPQFPVENHPRVSEKDYKAALEKIPTPSQKYDPWGGAHTSEAQKGTADSAKSPKKGNSAN